MLIDCHNCQREFQAEYNSYGHCPLCKTNYDSCWQSYEDEEGLIQDDIMYIFETESAAVIKSFLGVEHFKDEKFNI